MAIYGMIQSSLLFYKKLRKDLESEKFEVNSYDPCVANKIINGNQMTVSWHVDDLKVSHKESKFVEEFIEWIKSKYENFTKVKPSRGKRHDYLGMTLDYSVPGEVTISMTDYVKKMLKDFYLQDEIKGQTAKTPAAEHLFNVNPNGKKLSKNNAEAFHTTVAQGLFLCKRARPDIQPTVPFLCTRVKNPDEDDQKKLIRLMRYLNGTIDLALTLRADDITRALWYANIAFAVHFDMKSHTGGVLTMGKGAIQTMSSKQKLTTKSTTEAELVGADDILPQLLWTKYFLEKQGYKCNPKLYQDNKSAILLEKNGRESSGKRTRHIRLRYYFITDRIEKKDLQVKFCPTDDMIADYMTKPLQGMKFRKFRKLIMGMP